MLHDTEPHEIWPSCGPAAILLLLAKGGSVWQTFCRDTVSRWLHCLRGFSARPSRGFSVTTWFNRGELLFRGVSALPVSKSHMSATSGTVDLVLFVRMIYAHCGSYRADGGICLVTHICRSRSLGQLAG